MAVILTIGYREYRDPPPSQWREALDRLDEYENDEEPVAVSLTCLDVERCVPAEPGSGAVGFWRMR